MTWQQLNEHPDYEIYSEYDGFIHCYPIRQIGKGDILITNIYNAGYVYIYIWTEFNI